MSDRARAVDMSSAAIDRRLRELSDLVEFCLRLQRDCGIGGRGEADGAESARSTRPSGSDRSGA